LVVQKTVRRLERAEKRKQALHLARPQIDVSQNKVVAFTPSESGKLLPAREVAELQDMDTFALYGAAQELVYVLRLFGHILNGGFPPR